MGMILWYWIPQFTGAVMAHYVLKTLIPIGNYGVNDVFMYLPAREGSATEQSYYEVHAVFNEIFGAFVFCLVALNLRHRSTTFSGSKILNIIIEALAMWYILLITNPLTNFSTANPAVAAGLAFTTAVQTTYHHYF